MNKVDFLLDRGESYSRFDFNSQEAVILVCCPECNGFEMGSTADTMTPHDWKWIRRMKARKGWKSALATSEGAKALSFGCRCTPKRKALPTRF